MWVKLEKEFDLFWFRANTQSTVTSNSLVTPWQNKPRNFSKDCLCDTAEAAP